MDQYVGKICPVCSTVIMPNEDVRVCRCCGIAYHADCWQKNNGCITAGCPGGNVPAQTAPPQSAQKRLCRECGAELPAGSPVCVKCGAPVEAENSRPAAPAAPAAPESAAGAAGYARSAGPVNYAPGAIPGVAQAPAAPPGKQKNATVAYLLGILSGIASIVMGIVCFGMYAGSGFSFETYGGDAYTGIQNAAAQTARNVRDLADIARFGFGSLLIVVGVAILALFIAKIMESNKKA